jgi:L-lactate dehydrogenase complex protein LldG
VIPKDDARQRILRAIRENLAASGAHDAPPPDPTFGARAPLRASGAEAPPSPTLATRFAERVAAVDAHCTIVSGEVHAAQALTQILTEARARRVVGSDAPLVQRLLRALPDGFACERLEGLSRDQLFATDAGVTAAQWGIAETGTLVLESASERSRLLSLVPPLHVAVLSARRICASLGDALGHVQGAHATLASHAITLITGPSRTSDIELTLVVGVHGPQAVHVLLMEDA